MRAGPSVLHCLHGLRAAEAISDLWNILLEGITYQNFRCVCFIQEVAEWNEPRAMDNQDSTQLEVIQELREIRVLVNNL